MNQSTEKTLYVKGDATDPIYLFKNNSFVNEVRIIVHICNDINKWGSSLERERFEEHKGFVMALSSRWPTINQVFHMYNTSLF
jgi:hypothetical protein